MGYEETQNKIIKKSLFVSRFLLLLLLSISVAFVFDGFFGLILFACLCLLHLPPLPPPVCVCVCVCVYVCTPSCHLWQCLTDCLLSPLLLSVASCFTSAGSGVFFLFVLLWERHTYIDRESMGNGGGGGGGVGVVNGWMMQQQQQQQQQE